MRKIKPINLKVKPAANYSQYSYLENWEKFHVRCSNICCVIELKDQIKHCVIHLN